VLFGYRGHPKTVHVDRKWRGSSSRRLKPRPVFFVKDKQLLKGILAPNGEVDDPQPIENVSVSTGQYEKVNAPNLYPAKEAQRKDLVKSVDGGTVLELNAGRGNLTREVYAKKLDKAVLVDEDKRALASADKKLNGKIKHETNVGKNVKWLENEMSPAELKNLKVVDFDPFGSPSDCMKTFFDEFPVKRSMFIGVTDGSKRYLGYVPSKKGSAWLKENYGVEMHADGSREDQIRVLDAFMVKQGQKHGFHVTPINVGYGRGCAVYAGYKITPN
jgi:hypothetical protein